MIEVSSKVSFLCSFCRSFVLVIAMRLREIHILKTNELFASIVFDGDRNIHSMHTILWQIEIFFCLNIDSQMFVESLFFVSFFTFALLWSSSWFTWSDNTVWTLAFQVSFQFITNDSDFYIWWNRSAYNNDSRYCASFMRDVARSKSIDNNSPIIMCIHIGISVELKLLFGLSIKMTIVLM